VGRRTSCRRRRSRSGPTLPRSPPKVKGFVIRMTASKLARGGDGGQGRPRRPSDFIGEGQVRLRAARRAKGKAEEQGREEITCN